MGGVADAWASGDDERLRAAIAQRLRDALSRDDEMMPHVRELLQTRLHTL